MDVGYFTIGNLLLIIGYITKKAIGDGEVLVHFYYFSNPSGRLLNGYCCDGWPFCSSPCDLSFSVCLDFPNWYYSTSACKFGSYQSGVVTEDSDNVIFAHNFGGLNNPLSFIVPGAINRKVTLKVDVRDVDSSTSDDLVDFLRGDLWLYKGHRHEFRYPFDMVSRTRLYTVITVRCAPDWYGDTCRVYCAPPGPKQHYGCDVRTGRKICHKSWGGQTCSIKLGLKIKTRTKWIDKIKRRSQKAYDKNAIILKP